MTKTTRYVEVVYRCRCMPGDAAVQVRERLSHDTADWWVRHVMAHAITVDHRRRSPLCQSEKMMYAKIRMPSAPDAPIGAAEGGTA